MIQPGVPGRVETFIARHLRRAYRTVHAYPARNWIDIEMAAQLMAGAGGAHITPPIGFPMGGYGARHQGAQGVHDQLNTHTLFLDDGTTQVLIIASDLIGLRAPQVARVRALVSAGTGVPAEHVFLACSHTHGGPLMYDDFGDMPSEHEAYLETLYHYLAGAARQAATSAIPVHYGCGRSGVRLGVNRRERQADGSIRIGVDFQGPVAPWADVVFFNRVDGGGTLALLYQHAVHGTCLMGDNYLFTADMMGYAMRLIEDRLASSTALFLNGCAGNINPYPRGTFDLAARHGSELGAAVLKALTSAGEIRKKGRISCVQHPVKLPLQAPESLEKSERDLACVEREYRQIQGAHHENWTLAQRYFTAKERVAAAREQDTAASLPIEIQVIAIDDIALVGLPGEIFVETGFAIAAASPFAVTLPVGYANGSIGYVPTCEAVPDGGYEVIDARARYRGRYIRADADRVLTQGASAALAAAFARIDA